jgi:phosphoserine aminotransferase
VINRVLNFNAGPSALALPVLRRAQKDLLNFGNEGMSVMEMGHRSRAFSRILESAETRLRRIMALSDDYAVLFLSGGASYQFAMAPLNFYRMHHPVNLVHTGYWTLKAAKEIEKLGELKIIASGEADQFKKLPKLTPDLIDPEASYLHYCSNNTIYGTQWNQFIRQKNTPTIVDMSSDFLSRKIDFHQFDLIYAGAQKNVAIAGMSVAVIRKDFAKNTPPNIPSVFRYQNHIEAQGLYNTPPTFAIYMSDLVFEWIEDQGGLEGLEKKNQSKAKLLYDYIDESDFYHGVAESSSRSKMNVLFRIRDGDESLEHRFVSEAESAGILGLKGHRHTGGLRASLYNAIELQAVAQLVDFMKSFAKKF